MTSNPGARMGLRRPPYVFTEHGALQLASVLKSERAVDMSLLVVRAFVHSCVCASYSPRIKNLQRSLRNSNGDSICPMKPSPSFTRWFGNS